MGRLPASFAGRSITWRCPYNMSGELVLSYDAASVFFPDATFSHQIDRPFEIHRMIPRIVGLDAQGVVVETQPDQDILAQLIRLQVKDFSKEENLMKSPTIIATLTKGSSERTWEWAEPATVVRSEGYQISANTLADPGFDDITQLKLEINFQGFLITIAPPSENR